MILFTFAPVVIALVLLTLGEVFHISFMLTKYSHEGALSWAPEDVFPPRTLDDHRWEEMINEAVEATTPQGSYGGNSYPSDEEYWEHMDELFRLFQGAY